MTLLKASKRKSNKNTDQRVGIGLYAHLSRLTSFMTIAVIILNILQIDDHVLQITKHASQHPTARQIDITGSHSLDDFWRHGVHDVTNQSDRGNDGCGFVDEGLVVTRNRNTWFLTSLFIDAVVIVALGEGQE